MWGSEKEKQTRLRIQICLWAYAYEFRHDSIVSDGAFDEACAQVDLSIETDRPDLDKWFKKNFDKCTGQWIYSHPELREIEKIYNRFLQRDKHGKYL